MRFKSVGAIVASAALVATLSACSQNSGGGSAGGYKPSGNITMLVPFGAGGGSDISGRAIADGLESVTGLRFTTTNVEGGSGAVGYAQFQAQKGNDTYLLPAETAMLALPISQPDVTFTYQDFTPIMKLGDDASVMVVKQDSPYNSCKEVVDASKNKRVVAGVSGAISNDAVLASLLEKNAGAKLDRVPFESGGEVVAALLGGKVDVIFNSPSEVMGQIEAKQVKPLCVFSEERFTYDALKDVPTAPEQGIDVTYAQFRSFIAPGGISEESKQYWIDAAKKFAESDAYKSYIEDNMMQPDAAYGDDFSAYLKTTNDELKKALAK